MKFFNKIFNSYSFLVVGKTAESSDQQEGFKRYVGVGSSYVLAVNPDKKTFDELMGFESSAEPEYVTDGENGKEARATFIVRTDPDQCNGIEITNRLTFTLRNAPAYNADQTKVQVIDKYGNHTWMDTEDARSGKTPLSSEGKELKIDKSYRMACVGECDLIDFLKAYLCVQDVFKYTNGSWVKKDNAEDYLFSLEHIKDYFSGNFSELKDAIALQPNNKVKLLYGVRTTEEGKQRQVICSRGDMIMRSSAGTLAYGKVADNLAKAKERGSYANTDYRVCELQEWSVEATNLENESASAGSEMPWD